MQDPRLKPVVVSPPTEPSCTLGALLAGPLGWLGRFACEFLEQKFHHHYDHSHPRKSLLQTYCFSDDPYGASLDAIFPSIFTLSGPLLGLILLWFAVERNEVWKPARKPAFFINTAIFLLMVVDLFIQTLPVFHP